MKTNNRLLAVIVGTLLIISAEAVDAQKNWSFELRPGMDFATKHLGDAKLKTGFGFEGTFSYKLMPHLAAYTGWSWNKFSTSQSFAGSNTDFDETGYCLGLQFSHPISAAVVGYIVKGGATYNHIETENSAGKIINDTGHGFGWQAGVGITIPLGERVLLVPEVRYRSLTRDMKFGDAITPVDLNYVSAGIGISYSF